MTFKMTPFTAAGRYFIDLRFVLFFIAIAYIAFYFAISATPGNSPQAHPLGWWGWFDQGQYLLSANALSQGDLTPAKHFYPPLYPGLGAIFLHWSSGHMYFVPNLICLLWFSFVFVRVSDRYIPRWGSVALLFGTTVFNHTLFENYVIPWTTTLSVALLASVILGLVWLHEIRDGVRLQVSRLQVLFVALCLGMMVPTRPADAVIGGVVALGLIFGYWRTWQIAPDKVPRLGQFLFFGISGAAIGPLLFFGFNFAVFATPLGGYMQAASANGFFIADLPEKFVSLWLDSFTLYGEPKAGLTERYPWLFLSLAGLVWVLIRGDSLLRFIATAIILLFVLYMPYGDLLPNGLWRYLNIHYFKWTFPFLGLFACLLVIHVLDSWQHRKGWTSPAILLIGLPALLLSLHLVVDVTPVSTHATNNSSVVKFDLPNKQVDLVDFKGLSGGFTDIYFGPHRLVLDGRVLQRTRDYRVLPISSGVRVLFIRPVLGHSVEFYPDPKLSRFSSPLAVQVGTYRFALGALKPFRHLAQHEVVSEYHIGDVIDFSQQGNGRLYAARGWSGPEDWGRWSINGEALIQMRLADLTTQALGLELELVVGAFVNRDHPCQEIIILVNGKEIARQSLCDGKGGEQPTSYKFVFERKLVPADGRIDLSLVTPNSISPKTLRVSVDDRVLGVGIRSLRLVASEH